MKKHFIQAVVPCAGMGTRLLPASKCVPKELLAVYDRPAIQHVLEEALAAGIRKIILVCNPGKIPLEEHFRANGRLERFLSSNGKSRLLGGLRALTRQLKIHTVYQSKPLGLGHAILCARDAIRGECFSVLLPDVIFTDGGRNMKSLLQKCGSGRDWGIVLKKMEKSQLATSGVVNLGGGPRATAGGRILGAVEKPGAAQAPSRFGIIGRYVLPTAVLDLLKAQARSGGEIELTTALNELASIIPGKAVITQSRYFDVGTHNGLAEANHFFWKKSSSTTKRP